MNTHLKTRRKMRNFFIPKSGQLYYAIVFSFLGFLFFVATVVVLGVNFISPDVNPCIQEGKNFCQVQIFDTLIAVTPKLFQNIILVILLGLANITVYFILGLLISHRTFGPLIGINRHLDSLLEKDYSSRINLRKHDQFATIADKLNLLAEKLGGKKD